jgi:hypothetical protein
MPTLTSRPRIRTGAIIEMTPKVSSSSPQELSPAVQVPPPPVLSPRLLSNVCTHPFHRMDHFAGHSKRMICGRWRCSIECAKRYMSILRSRLHLTLRTHPAQIALRLTVSSAVASRVVSALFSTFFRILRAKVKCEYFAINEWASGHRHLHGMIRSDEEISRELVAKIWSSVLDNNVGSQHSDRIRDQVRYAKYVTKMMVVPPPQFKGKLHSYSRGFFTDAITQRMKEKRAASKRKKDPRY